MICSCKLQWLGLTERTAKHLLPHARWRNRNVREVNVREVFYRVSIFMTIIFFKFKEKVDELSDRKNNAIEFDQ